MLIVSAKIIQIFRISKYLIKKTECLPTIGFKNKLLKN